MNILAICGSLRRGSSNLGLLRAASRLAPSPMKVSIYEGLGALPHFNPDLDREGATPPQPVRELRALIGEAAGLLISSPEYAHGVPGSMKNALDWLVSSPEPIGKPVLLLNAAANGGEFAQASLAETLRVMGFDLLTDASRMTPFLLQKLDDEGSLIDSESATAIRTSLDALGATIRQRHAARD
ncbi:MAG: NADPH-dependent FMN reductase [Thermoanaerobaculia bacterium]